MTEIDRSQFYSGGFFLVRASETPQGLDKNSLLPAKLISLSACFCKKFDIVWTWTPYDKEAGLEFGIPESKWEELIAWCKHVYQKDQLDLYGMFNSKQFAQDCIELFLPDTDDLYLIEIGLPTYPSVDSWHKRSLNEGSPAGVDLRISRQIPILETGNVLGYEVLSYDYHNLGHTWLCSLIHNDMYELYGIKPNQHGFLATYDDAKKVYDWIAEEEMKGTRAEPEPYDFWLVISHPLAEDD